MNYIWAGLILISVVFAVGGDVNDQLQDTFRNNHIYKAKAVDQQAIEPMHGKPTKLLLMNSHVVVNASYQVSGDRIALEIEHHDSLPEQWQHRFDDEKTPILVSAKHIKDQFIDIQLAPIVWQRLQNMMQAAFDMATFAAKLALGLIGLMALWLGLMKIAEQAGLIQTLVRIVRPVLKYLFPDIPKDHPAMGAISLNLAANMLGLGNAATPMGIKAMQHLQELNEHKEQASDSMCMFLALNTSSVQLLPPVTVIALLGVHASGLFVSILLATLCSTIVAIVAARWFRRRHAKASAA